MREGNAEPKATIQSLGIRAKSITLSLVWQFCSSARMYGVLPPHQLLLYILLPRMSQGRA